MKNSTYSRLLMAPLLMLLAVACAPNQFNQTSEYDDVYFTSSDRSAQASLKTKTQQTLLDQQQKQVVVENYSNTNVNAQIIDKYNNGEPQQVTYFEDGPIVKSARDLNYDDFVADYENEQLAHYDLPLDWSSDWNRGSFNVLMNQDYSFRLAWYDQYYLGRNFRMNLYLSGRSGRSGRFGNNFAGPRVGLGFGIGATHYSALVGRNNTIFIDLNPFGFSDPFWRPRFRRRGFFFSSFNDPFYNPFYCPPFYNNYNGFGWRNGWRNNVFVNNNIFIDRQADRVFATRRGTGNITRGPRVGTSRIATVRNEAVNGSAPATRSSRYVDNLSGNRSSSSTVTGTSRGRASLNNSGTRTSRNTDINGSSRSSVRTDAYNNGSSRSSRSSALRNNGSSRSGRSSSLNRGSSRSSSGTSAVRSSGSRSRSNPSFSGRSSSRSSYSRGSSSRSSSGSRSSYSRGSSSRSGSSRSSGSISRGSSSRSSGSASRGSSSRSSSRSSSGSASRGSSSRSSGSSRSSSSSSSRSGSSSSRSSRGN